MGGIPLGVSNESVTGEPFGRDVIGPLPTVESPPLLRHFLRHWPLPSGGGAYVANFAIRGIGTNLPWRTQVPRLCNERVTLFPV